MSTFPQRALWENLAGACVVAVVAAVPVLMSGVMDRGFEIAKQSVAHPLALLALGAVLLAGGWCRIIQLRTATGMASLAIAVFLALAGISLALSETPAVALYGGYYRREGLIAWCGYGAFFFAVLGWAYRPDRLTGLLDVLLLTSVIPASYVFQQRLDLDFYAVLARDLTRPGATLGSPVFLAAYFALLLPITVARCWQACRRPPELALWLTITLLQTGGLLVTQSRGPLLALLFGILMLACLGAGHARARRVFLAAGGAFALVVAALTAINLPSPIQQWAQDTPVLSRLVFDPGTSGNTATAIATRSATARLGIWGAGTETFTAAPLYRQLFGFGPESAYMHYFPHMPALVMRMDGYAASSTYDRLHADTLDISLNFGLLAWLVYCFFFASVVYAAARALFGLSGMRPAWAFFGLTVFGGAMSSLAAIEAGLAPAAVPAFGLGISAGWFLFVAACAWRALKHGIPRLAAIQAGHWTLLAGLTSALLVFWVDAQVNIPVLTTRLISFAIAALILVIADGILPSADDAASRAPAHDDRLWLWGIAFSLVAGCASVIPEVFLDARTQPYVSGHWWLRTLPLLSFMLIAALAAWVHVRQRGSVTHRAAWSWLAVAIGLPVLYVACHFALMVKLGPELVLSDVTRISIVSFAGPVFICAMCILYAVLASSRAVSATNGLTLSRTARYSVFALAALVVVVWSQSWRATRADVASMVAQWAASGQPDVSEQLVNEAIRIMPYERYYQRQLIFDMLGRAVADIRELGNAPDRYRRVERNLAVAELQARETLNLFPRDPWSVLALANVLQIRALRLLRPRDPDAGETAAQESNQLFLLAHNMFPTQPLLLRNWAQLMFDQGNVPDAYRLLDLMEALIPREFEPYAERIAIARQISDSAVVSSTLSRAHRMLEPQLYRELLVVANPQQN